MTRSSWCERGVAEQIVAGEDDVPPDRVDDAVTALAGLEMARPARLRHVLQLLGGVDAEARVGQCPLVQVGGEDLRLDRLSRALDLFLHEHRDRVGLLAARAAGHPGAKPPLGREPREQPRQHLDLERLEAERIPEELRDADEQIVVQAVELVLVLQEPFDIG